jgi:DNA-directed RNA polymerase specialized sigma24 family protein
VLELHTARDRRRATASRAAEAVELLPEPERDEPPVEPAALHAALERVGPPGADVIRMRHFEGLPFGSIASARREPVGTVKARYYRAMTRLREALEAHLRGVRG